MGKEIKICLPFYKIVYSAFFTAVLSLIRGVNFSSDIGVALEPQIAILAAVFCADTYVQEIVSKRSEVERLYPIKNRVASVYRRIGIQEMYLLVLAFAGYGMFYIFQNPVPYYGTYSWEKSEMGQFLICMAAIMVTIVFWGMLSLTLSCLFRNMWAGIGGCLILWIITDSTTGENLLGKWNLFSYTFRNAADSGDMSWVCGKIVSVAMVVIMLAVLPQIIKKRG